MNITDERMSLLVSENQRRVKLSNQLILKADNLLKLLSYQVMSCKEAYRTTIQLIEKTRTINSNQLQTHLNTNSF
jgi:hypothetical protein